MPHPHLVVFYDRTRRCTVAIARSISFALMSSIFARCALWSFPAATRLPAPTGMARRADAPPLRIGAPIVGDEADGLQLLLLLLLMVLRRWGVSLGVGMDGVLSVVASHGWVSNGRWALGIGTSTTTGAVAIQVSTGQAVLVSQNQVHLGLGYGLA